MKYKLIAPINNNLNAKQQVLTNRGIHIIDLYHYMNLSDKDINNPFVFGEVIKKAAYVFTHHILHFNQICVIVDCDCDGYTSAATILNYIYDITPNKSNPDIMKNVDFFHHESKQHGLSDAMDWIKGKKPDLVIIPDAGSNDIAQLRELEEMGIDVIILDHHEIEEQDFWRTEMHPHLYLINSQSPQYPNKELSGVGVVYQFCRAIENLVPFDEMFNFTNNYLDLVALGNTGDMMSLRSFETKYLISKGLEPQNIKNPFIYEMWQKNKFKLGDKPTSWGVTFYIVPFVNAITRSGTLEEKKLVFDAMLKYKAFQQIPSNKRGHKPGEMERIVDQAIRTCTNVKNRQGRAEEAGLELIEGLIQKNNMMDHKVLLFLLEPDAIKPEIRGLIANKIMAKYQRPCCILTKTIETIKKDIIVQGDVIKTENGTKIIGGRPQDEIYAHTGPGYNCVGVAWGPGILEEEIITYQGSARGCDKVGVTNFKDICAATDSCEYTVGHQGAFGLGIRENNIQTFIKITDFYLKDMASEPIYYVDYIWSANNVSPEKILDIADMNNMWGKDIDEALVAVEEIKVTKNNITMMASNTVKITLPNGVSIIKFRMPDEEYKKLYSENGYVTINAICRCNKNEWNGNVSAQLLLEDYEIIGRCIYEF